MPKYEYTTVERASIKELDELGEDGWRPASLRYQEGCYDKPFDPERWIEGGWTGLLYRETGD